MSWQHIAAEVVFISAGIIAVRSIVRTIWEAWPRIVEIINEDMNDE